ncbi:MAG: glycosyltransferase family 4 protein [Candidatus Woesebacteria bacterium]|nr:glycosyltransferase family 4 protein [Candidatus Woesebacteria bacterium]
MRAAIYNPYLDTLGGGERYTTIFAKVLAKNGYTVDLEWKYPRIKNTIGQRFGITLDEINIVKDIKKGDGYDLCFWISNGSIPMLHARKNILHFQVPFHDVGGKSLLNKMKLFRINKIVCNSVFTKRIIDKEYGIESVVIYPPVDTLGIKPKRKENLILFVGRFSQILQNKGQDVLIKAFKKMCDQGLNDWKLILAGGVEVGVGDYVEKLRNLAQGYPVEIFESPDYKTLKDLYGRAKLFWSASGYNENEEKNPEKVEHFGITVVEAMAGGAIPVVYEAGGHKEVVIEGENGFLWKTTFELTKKTRGLITDSKLLHKIALNAKKSAEKYTEGLFENNIVSYILQK